VSVLPISLLVEQPASSAAFHDTAGPWCTAHALSAYLLVHRAHIQEPIVTAANPHQLNYIF
jgi:hypothetical protein